MFSFLLGIVSATVGFLIGKHSTTTTTSSSSSSSSTSTKRASTPPTGVPQHLIKPSMRRGAAHFGLPAQPTVPTSPSTARRGAGHFGLNVPAAAKPTAAASPGGNLSVPMPPEIKALVDKTIGNEATTIEMAAGLRWQKKNYGPGFNPERSIFTQELRRKLDKPTADKIVAAA